MTSYQKLKKQNEQLEKELLKASDFERQMKNLINAIAKGQSESINNIIRWFAKNSEHYSNQIIGGKK